MSPASSFIDGAAVRLRRACLAGALCAVPVASAWALQGGAVDSNADATFAGIGSLTVAGNGTFSGVLVAPQYVLTAAHVAGPGADPSDYTFNVNLDSLPAGDRTFAVTAITVAPGFTGFHPGEITRNDLALLRLDRPVPASVPTYAPLSVGLVLDQQVTLVGYGGTGAPTVKNRGTNLVEFLDPAPSAGSVPDVFAYDFDSDTAAQATVVGGDSGSAALVNLGGVWKLAGINTFSWENPAVPGTGAVRGGGGMIVSAYADWIQSAQNPAPVPEVRSWGLILLGLVALFAGRHFTRLRPAR